MGESNGFTFEDIPKTTITLESIYENRVNGSRIADFDEKDLKGMVARFIPHLSAPLTLTPEEIRQRKEMLRESQEKGWQQHLDQLNLDDTPAAKPNRPER